MTTRQLLRDPVFWKAFRNTAFYIVTIVPLQLALGLTIAVALNQAIRARSAFRMIYFLPVVTTIVAGAIVFRLILAKNGPLANLVGDLGGLLGLPLRLPDLFEGSTKYSKWSVVLLTLWKNTGFTMVVYWPRCKAYRKSCTTRPTSTAPAPRQRFRNVTWPMITPTTFFLVILQDRFRTFQLFTEPFVITRGGPAQSSDAGRPVHLRRQPPLHAHGQSVGHRLVPLYLHFRLHARAKHHAAAVGSL